MIAAAGKVGDDHLRVARRFQVAAPVGEANDGVGVRNVDVSGIRAGRIESNPERLFQVRREYFRHVRFAGSFGVAQNDHAVRAAFRHEHIAIRGYLRDARIVQVFRPNMDMKSRRHGQTRAVGPRNDGGSVVGGAGGVGRGQVGGANHLPLRGLVFHRHIVISRNGRGLCVGLFCGGRFRCGSFFRGGRKALRETRGAGGCRQRDRAEYAKYLPVASIHEVLIPLSDRFPFPLRQRAPICSQATNSLDFRRLRSV